MDQSPHRIDRQVVDCDGLFLFAVVRSCGQMLADTADAAQRSSDTRHDFLEAERLGDVVVCANFQPHNTVQFFCSRGKHHDVQQRMLRAEPPAHLNTIEARQHHIQQNQIGDGFGDEVQRIRPRGGRLDVESLLRQPVGDERAQVVVVFNNKYVAGSYVNHVRPS